MAHSHVPPGEEGGTQIAKRCAATKSVASAMIGANSPPTKSSVKEDSAVAGSADTGPSFPQEPAGQRHGFAPDSDSPLVRQQESSSWYARLQHPFWLCEPQVRCEPAVCVWAASLPCGQQQVAANDCCTGSVATANSRKAFEMCPRSPFMVESFRFSIVRE